MPCAAACFSCSALPRTNSSPPCTFGCSVFTRPSSISGKPVSSATSFTGSPSARSAAAVPPVEISSTPISCSARANATRPVLSETESSARRIFCSPVMPPVPQRTRSTAHLISLLPKVAATQHDLHRRARPGAAGEIGALLDGKRGAVSGEPPALAAGQRQLGIVRVGLHPARDIGVQVEMDGERHIRFEAEVALAAVQTVTTLEAHPVRRELQVPPVLHPKAALVAIVARFKRDAPVDVLEMPVDVVGLSQRHPARPADVAAPRAWRRIARRDTACCGWRWRARPDSNRRPHRPACRR